MFVNEETMVAQSTHVGNSVSFKVGRDFLLLD